MFSCIWNADGNERVWSSQNQYLTICNCNQHLITADWIESICSLRHSNTDLEMIKYFHSNPHQSSFQINEKFLVLPSSTFFLLNRKFKDAASLLSWRFWAKRWMGQSSIFQALWDRVKVISLIYSTLIPLMTSFIILILSSFWAICFTCKIPQMWEVSEDKLYFEGHHG